MQTIIKDASGKTLGYKKQRGNRIIVENASGKCLGWYEPNTNKTVNSGGKALFTGDQTSMLLGLK
jgi:hypothetical protein